jgi:hypothetical protein
MPEPKNPTGPAERRRGFSVGQQLQVVAPLVFVWAAGFSVLAAVAVRGDVGELLLDPTYASGGEWYLGAVSQFGVLAWTVAAGAAAAGSWIAGRVGRANAARFLRMAAIAGSVLLVDDLFALHATVLGPLTGKLVGQLLVLLPMFWWMTRFFTDILRTRWQVLLCALVSLGVAAVVDVVLSPTKFEYTVLAEDGAKFLGILAWATYCVMTSRDIAVSALGLHE